ncbi:pentapeptide repeat-containing protein [Pseudooceanicola sp.]|uniref:pentapeptide repeat-containing protein n=1 Tax=Pseudooceanicola sp. TaxID=1914328 RepID=UPI002607CE13|nr:pentapeptide repeat-containing protein [Pseudooceanicola sp.]MDF1856949.1 pentapeptide repeat-containing protein [Pseudooceanicola sp.]
MSDTDTAQEPGKRALIELDGGPRGLGAWMTVLVFLFGIGAGVLMAFSGYAVLENSANLLVTVFLTGIFVITLFGVIAFALRRPVLRYFFGVANTQLETLSLPLGDAAEGAVERDAKRVTAALRVLVKLMLARLAWSSTRNWIIASLTGLVAALAALAGTALLFEQNELIAHQSQLLTEQNDKVELQNDLLIQDVQLAEAERNAQIAVEITSIAELLGDAMIRADERAQSVAAASGQPVQGGVRSFRPEINPWLDLGKPLLMRITSASRAAKPYRFLDARFRAHDDADKLRVAMETRRDDLPSAYAAMKQTWGWQDPPEVDHLIDRPASPERAQLLQVLMSAGVKNYEFINHFGLDLSFAFAEDTDLIGITLQGAQLSFATFDRAQVIEADFAGAALENSRFRKARIEHTAFRGLPYRQLRAPYQADDMALFMTALNGADFSDSLLREVDFQNVHGSASRFDRATLAAVKFTGSDFSGATFRGAVILSAYFAGATLKSVDFDGAYVFDAGFLDRLTAETEGFLASRFRMVPVPVDEAFATVSTFSALSRDEALALAGAETAWRVERIAAFEEATATSSKDTALAE